MPYDRTTSLPAFQEAPQGKDYCRQVVLLTIRKLGVCSDREIAQHLGWPINRITPRRGELVTQGRVYRAKVDTDPATNRTVNFWAEAREFRQLRLF